MKNRKGKNQNRRRPENLKTFRVGVLSFVLTGRMKEPIAIFRANRKKPFLLGAVFFTRDFHSALYFDPRSLENPLFVGQMITRLL